MKLSEEAYKATCGDPMRRIGEDDSPPFDFWEYFESIPAADFEGHDCSEGEVDHAWNDPSETYQHVLVSSENRNVFMVLVLDLVSRAVHGHRLLDLDREYGVSPPSGDS